MANFLVGSLLHLSYSSFPCFLFVFSSPLHVPNSTQADIQQVGEMARNSTHEVDMMPMSEDTQATMAEKSEKEVHNADKEEDRNN